MSFLLVVTVLLSIGAETVSSPVLIPPADKILDTLKKEHPRLLMTAGDFTELQKRVRTDNLLRKWHRALEKQATQLLTEPPSKYEIPDGLRLLDTSRRVLDRVRLLSLLYRLGGNRAYAERAFAELDAAAHFKDWNPRHFLDTAEMTHAFAIGYDWLYDYLSPEQRFVLRTAMIEKGIQLALGNDPEFTWWKIKHHNWNQVCNSGIGMGALALADVEPQLAAEFLHAALESIQLPMAEYGPDGGWAEGPGYWHYGTGYNVVFIAALETALGTDFGSAKIDGFSQTGTFPIYMSGPTGATFNFADSPSHTVRAPEMFWLAKKYDRPDYAAYELGAGNGSPLDIVWYDAQPSCPTAKTPPLDKYYRHAEVVTLRSAWDDPEATFVGFKAGDNHANHSHLDLGSFVLDALGTRWAEDLGRDDYNLPGYFGAERRTYYRLRAEGHNTLVINPGAGPDQEPKATVAISRFESKPERAFAIADLTPAYVSQAKHVARGIALLGRNQVLVQDEISTEAPSDVWWFFHTTAAVSVEKNGAEAILAIGEKRLIARILWPQTATFSVMPAEPLATSPHPSGQNQNKGMRKLAIHLSKITDLNLAVLLTPAKEDPARQTPALKPTPLSLW